MISNNAHATAWALLICSQGIGSTSVTNTVIVPRFFIYFNLINSSEGQKKNKF